MSKKLGKLAALTISMWLFAPCVFADSPDPVIATDDLQADVTILERAYRELHPGLLRYLTPSQLAAAVADLRREFQTPRRTSEAFLAFARFAATIRCGHTYTNFFNQPREVQTLIESMPRLPFYFRWLDSKMIVTKDFTDSQVLPAGTEVIRINGVSTDTILKRLLPLTRADGSNDSKRIDQLSVTGDSVYEAFDVYYPLLYRFQTNSVRLTVRRWGTPADETVQVRAQSYAERIAPIEKREQARRGGADPQFEWRYLQNGAAYLNMPTWALYQSKWDWRGWLNSQLDELVMRDSAALIIDLRGNEGGEDIGDMILSRLIERDLTLGDSPRLVRYRAVPQDLVPYLDTWDRSFADWGNEALEMKRPWPTTPHVHYFSLGTDSADHEGRRVLHPALPRFSGKVFVLVDAANSSATFQFAEVIQRRKLGILVGGPTGGNLRGINGGAFFFLRLPHSKIELDLPLIGTFPARQERDQGLKPDIKAELPQWMLRRGPTQGWRLWLGRWTAHTRPYQWDRNKRL